jgi:hypothetical protein
MEQNKKGINEPAGIIREKKNSHKEIRVMKNTK